MPNWTDEYSDMVNDCIKRQERMNDWETGFINNMRQLLDRGKTPSVSQTEIIDKIWERATAKG